MLCLLVNAVIALMIRQLRKIKADSGKTPDDDDDRMIKMTMMVNMRMINIPLGYYLGAISTSN